MSTFEADSLAVTFAHLNGTTLLAPNQIGEEQIQASFTASVILPKQLKSDGVVINTVGWLTVFTTIVFFLVGMCNAFYSMKPMQYFLSYASFLTLLVHLQLL